MKTTMKQLAAGTFIALLLLVGNVNAEGTELKASSHENTESALEVENWMTDEAFWNTNSMSMTEFTKETETGMDLESWMINSATWNFDNNFIEDTEIAMEMENWMTSEETWNVNVVNNNSELTIENWMIDNKVWK